MAGRPKTQRFKKPQKHKMVGYKFATLVGGLFGTLALFLYPTVIQPMIDPTKWQEIQKEARAGYDQEKIQPGDMRVWTNPMKTPSKKE
ncbi:small integral membrane protein 20-like [Ylistrum balloti]|uniref:small integral membrane protein 20-like n=1 Tax=Ylistrum balloti TaxID=509963 RepID=UPI002905D081|nr:small integral membrane protein 20-like [Ylistrum balloti]